MPRDLQRRHYAMIASIISDLPVDVYGIEQVAEHFAKRLSGTNPHYNQARFLRAAKGCPDGRDRAALDR